MELDHAPEILVLVEVHLLFKTLFSSSHQVAVSLFVITGCGLCEVYSRRELCELTVDATLITTPCSQMFWITRLGSTMPFKRIFLQVAVLLTCNVGSVFMGVALIHFFIFSDF